MTKECFTVAALRARFADESMPWTRPHVESLISQIAELTKQRDDGWDNFYALRKQISAERYPGMTALVHAHEPTEPHDNIAKIVKEAAEHIEDICPRPGPYHPAFAALLEFADKVKFVPRGPDSEDEERAWVDGVAQMIRVLDSELERLKQPEKSSAPPEKPGHHCGLLKADCNDEFCPTHGRDIR